MSAFSTLLAATGVALATSATITCEPGFAMKNGACSPGANFAVDENFHNWSKESWANAVTETPKIKADMKKIIDSVPSYPMDQFHGRGIVIVAGGEYLRDAMATIASIRGFGCKLRIQVWYKGDAELPQKSLGFFDKYGVETYNLVDYVSEDAFKIISSNVGDRPFQLKPLAVKYTDLEEVLLLDADNTPTADPTYLFDDSRYQETGTVFWPDYWTTHSENPIFGITGVEHTSEREQESGQMLINKQAAWTAINTVTEMQTPLFYSLLNGDKDTFRFAWKMTNTPYIMNENSPAVIGLKRETISTDLSSGFCGHTMGQHDLDGKLLFIHHNNLKLSQGWGERGVFFDVTKTPVSGAHVRASPQAALEAGPDHRISCLDLEFAQDSDAMPLTSKVTDAGLKQWEQTFFDAVDEVKEFFPQPKKIATLRERRKAAIGNSTIVAVMTVTNGPYEATGSSFSSSTGLAASEFTACSSGKFLFTNLETTTADINGFGALLSTAGFDVTTSQEVLSNVVSMCPSLGSCGEAMRQEGDTKDKKTMGGGKGGKGKAARERRTHGDAEAPQEKKQRGGKGGKKGKAAKEAKGKRQDDVTAPVDVVVADEAVVVADEAEGKDSMGVTDSNYLCVPASLTALQHESQNTLAVSSASALLLVGAAVGALVFAKSRTAVSVEAAESTPLCEAEAITV